MVSEALVCWMKMLASPTSYSWSSGNCVMEAAAAGGRRQAAGGRQQAAGGRPQAAAWHKHQHQRELD